MWIGPFLAVHVMFSSVRFSMSMFSVPVCVCACLGDAVSSPFCESRVEGSPGPVLSLNPLLVVSDPGPYESQPGPRGWGGAPAQPHQWKY